MDPWSRRQQPFKIPKTPWYQRHYALVVFVITFGGGAIFFSRFIYDAFLKRYIEGPQPGMRIDMGRLLESKRVGRSDRLSWQEFLAEEQLRAEEKQRAKEKDASAPSS